MLEQHYSPSHDAKGVGEPKGTLQRIVVQM